MTEPSSAGSVDVKPVRVGRFTILRKLGQGGMGVVYAAFDEQLDRKIAVKVLRGDIGSDERGRARMMREAQALARLSHPNVVQVHEIGEFHGHDYVAMEFIEGRTLDRWLAARSRSWEEILAVMVQAGRGLAAAHEAGLIHRDFKPANIMVGEDGRVRVLDFGLARTSEECETKDAPQLSTLDNHGGEPTDNSGDELTVEASGSGVSGVSGPSAFATVLTMTGAVLGTPAYMAPEQHLGQSTSAASDQFSFCVVLYEALFGHRPYRAETRSEYVLRVTAGEFEVPKSSGAPLWLRNAVLRGLSVDPSERWPSVQAMLVELDRDRGRRWRRVLVAGGLFAALGLGLALSAGAEQPQRCTLDREAVAGSWDSQRETIEARFAGTGLAYASPAFEHVEDVLDGYIGTIADARLSTCEARWSAGSQGDADFSLRLSCLDQRERELEAVVETLADADADVVVNSTALLSGLGDVGLCERVDLIERGVPVPRDAEAVAEIAALRQDIARGQAAVDVGRMALAEDIIADAKARADALDYAPVLAELYLLEGRKARRELDGAEARRALGEALAQAQVGDDELLAASAWIQLAAVVAESDERDSWPLIASMAEASVDRIGGSPHLRAELHCALGLRLRYLGKLDSAREAFDRAVEFAERAEPSAMQGLANSLATRASVLVALGEVEAARTDLERVLAMGEEFGYSSPKLLDATFDLGALELEQDELDAAERHLRVAATGYQAIFGADYPGLIHAKLGLTAIALKRGQLDEARELAEAALAKAEGYGERDWALDGLAAVESAAGRHEVAEEAVREAIALCRGAAVHDELRVAYLEGRLAAILADEGDFQAALSSYQTALVSYQAAEGVSSHDLADLHLGLAEVHLARGERALARASVDEALALLPQESPSESLRARVLLDRVQADTDHQD
nr:serine/threonine-protein kinase [Pseudenhygromyxa sp. WMMC2535]